MNTPNHLFRIPDQLPKVPAKIEMFQATPFRSLSSRDDKHQTALAKRSCQATSLFKIKTEANDEGERLVFRQDSQWLQIYRASDLLWWANHDLAYRDSVDEEPSLPSEGEALEIAKRELERIKLDISNISQPSIAYVEASVAKPNEKPQTFRTAIDVNYGFVLGNYPVFGPGAKIKVSLAHKGQLAQVIYFWRKPSGCGHANNLN